VSEDVITISEDLLLEQGLILQRYLRDGWTDAEGEPLAALSTQHAAALAHAWWQLGHSSDRVLRLIEVIDDAMSAVFPVVSRDVFSADPVPKALREALAAVNSPFEEWITSATLSCKRIRDLRALLVHLAATYGYFIVEEAFHARAPKESLGARTLALSESDFLLLSEDPRPTELETA